MNDGRHSFGQHAESEAERYLRWKGYRILARNVRSSGGEIDLVAQDGPVLVFIEVKARRTSAFGGAVYAVHERKRTRLVRLAAQYLARHRLRQPACRFDVVLLQDGEHEGRQIQHIENAFEVPGEDLRW
jgi:putative endonuclease